MVRSSLAFGSIAALALASAASATLYTGAGFTIPDNNPNGGFSDIVITDEFLVADMTVSLLGLTHTWVGDLTATVTHLESGFTQTLFARPGKTDPNTGVGDSSNFNGNYAFNDAFAGNLWTAAAGGDSNFVVPGGNYFASAPLTGAQVSLQSVFGGMNAVGTWRLKIVDAAAADTGGLGSWTLNFVKSPVPAPGALALLGLAGLAGGRRRRA